MVLVACPSRGRGRVAKPRLSYGLPSRSRNRHRLRFDVDFQRRRSRLADGRIAKMVWVSEPRPRPSPAARWPYGTRRPRWKSRGGGRRTGGTDRGQVGRRGAQPRNAKMEDPCVLSNDYGSIGKAQCRHTSGCVPICCWRTIRVPSCWVRTTCRRWASRRTFWRRSPNGTSASDPMRSARSCWPTTVACGAMWTASRCGRFNISHAGPDLPLRASPPTIRPTTPSASAFLPGPAVGPWP